MTILSLIIYVSFFMSGALIAEGLDQSRAVPLVIGIFLVVAGFIAMYKAGLIK